MQKPNSLSVKNFLIRKISSDMIVPEKVVEAVINHQFTAVLDATANCYSIEISGFGKMMFNSKKAVKVAQKCVEMKMRYEAELQGDITKHRRSVVEAKLQYVASTMEGLKTKMTRHED